MDDVEEYEQQQEALRGELEGEDGSDFNAEDLRIPQVNPELYKDVTPLLLKGFLTVSATIHGVPFVFKSLNHHEFEQLGMMFDLQTTSSQERRRYYDSFLAYGVLMVGGVNVLKNRDEMVEDLATHFGELSDGAQRTIIRHLSEVNRRANRAVILIEPYVMETQSRLRWAQVKGLDISTTAITGFEGTQGLGLNWGQLTWRALNYYEDLKENAEREWENAKFIASSMAGKGMNKVYSADKRRRQTERDERVERREKVIRHALLNEPLNTTGPIGPVVVARTVEQLTDQLDRDLKGEKDWHDQVIQNMQQEHQTAAERRHADLMQAREEHIKKWGDRPIVSGTDLSGLSRQEVRDRMSSRQKDIARGLATQAAYPELSDPKQAEFQNKWINKPHEPIIQNAPTVITPPPPRPQGTPFKRTS